MLYGAIIGKVAGTPATGNAAMYKLLTTVDMVHTQVGTVSERDLVSMTSPRSQTRLKLLNASVVNGKLREDMGSLSRLQPKNGVTPHVLLAVYTTPSGRLVGYALASQDGRILRSRPDALYNACEKAKARGVSFLQNGIYRKLDSTAQIACYPNKPFTEFVQRQSNPKAVKAPRVKQQDIEANKKRLQERKKVVFTPQQQAELGYAKENGVNPVIIADPALSPEQMRVLWTAKKNKVCVEYFADKRYTPEQMAFLSSIFVNKKMFADCKFLLNPKYSVPQMKELFMGAANGLDYSTYADPNMPVKEMQMKRLELDSSTYSDPDTTGRYGDVKTDIDVMKQIVNLGLQQEAVK